MAEPNSQPTWFWLAVTLFCSLPALHAMNVTVNPAFSWQNNANATLNFTVTGNATSCALYTNESGFSQAANTTTLNASNNTFSHAFAEGTWTWTVSCFDGNTTAFAPSNASLGIDLTPPIAPNLTLSAFNVSWTPPVSDALSGFARTELYRNNTIILNNTNASVLQYVDANATANASFIYRLDVFDQAGNKNSTSATIDPLTALSNLTIIQIAPRIFNASWQTDQPANETVAFSLGNGTLINYTNTALKKQHSLNVTTPVFGSINGTLTSCLRACLNQTFIQAVPPTINISMVFYNATYNNQSALLSLRWDSLYGLTSVSVSTNNSGTMLQAYSSAFSNSSFHTASLPFTVNDSAPSVIFVAKGIDTHGESFQTDPYVLQFNPNVTQPVEPPAPNASYVALHIGQDDNVSNGYRLRLLGLSSIPTGSAQLMTAVFETFKPTGENESLFSMQENGHYNTSSVSVAMYRVFVGLGNTSYAQVDAGPIATPTPIPTASPIPTPVQTPTPTPNPANTPTPQPTPANGTDSAAYSGTLLNSQVLTNAQGGSDFSGYVLESDGTVSTAFNATYNHQGAATSLFFMVRVRDNATNKTIGSVRSNAKKASNGKTLTFSSDSMHLQAGTYVAEAMIVTEDKNAILDSKMMAFSVRQAGADEAGWLVGLLSALALGVFLFSLNINRHKKGLAK